MPRSKLLAAAAAAALLALALVAGACGGDDEEETDTSTPATTATAAAGGATATRAAGTATTAASGIGGAFTSLKSFRATITIESGGEKQEGTIESVPPDKLHLNILGLEIISIGADSWMKVGTSWTKQPGGGLGAGPFQGIDVSGTINSFSGPGVTSSGSDTVDGKRCQIYKTTAAGGTSEACVADGVVLRVISQTAAGKVTIVFKDINTNIEIKAPI